MAEFDRMTAQGGVAAGAASAEIDAGLRSHMIGVYNMMAGGLFVSFATAFLVASQPALVQAIYGTPLRWVVMLAPLGLIMLMSFRMNSMSASALKLGYWAFTLLMGVSLTFAFVAFDLMAVAQAFLTTSIAFMGLSLYGYTTKKNLSGWGSFLMMGLIGIIVASILNIFIGSGALGFAISIIGLLIFAGLTAYDTQRLKNEYLYMAQAGPEGQAWLDKSSTMGALSLYLNFVNMFQFLLMFMGGSDD